VSVDFAGEINCKSSYEFLCIHELELGFCYEKILYGTQIVFHKFIW